MTLPDFLRADERGEIFLAGHRVTLYHVLKDYREGFSAEMLAAAYPTVPLAMVHKVIAFYLENPAEHAPKAVSPGWGTRPRSRFPLPPGPPLGGGD